eukprot:Gregarina_sp_Pseudo_9__5048@NODE_5302_length_306_cov_6_254682_g4964_i0_p1_GENE_NODE_5302_length_306_cov_6_254682_g4964_i0NODE_5302_length_306_cov_6_254682_g4964_i0_p1_ORF_typecomplete_len100_score14_94Robl_LC7/PF03259_17/2_2e15LAMTOR5/PF16672_5/0_016DUF2118/PF09891_9/0_052MAPKK1_Int/PF08923_10/0_088_NODE_5302_length_306_cov_6_254682_g4964_i06275
MPGVQGVVVATRSGRTIFTTMQPPETKSAATVVAQCFENVENCFDKLDKEDEVSFVRIKTKKRSYMLSREGEYVLILLAEDQPNEPTGN